MVPERTKSPLAVVNELKGSLPRKEQEYLSNILLTHEVWLYIFQCSNPISYNNKM